MFELNVGVDLPPFNAARSSGLRSSNFDELSQFNRQRLDSEFQIQVDWTGMLLRDVLVVR